MYDYLYLNDLFGRYSFASLKYKFNYILRIYK